MIKGAGVKLPCLAKENLWRTSYDDDERVSLGEARREQWRRGRRSLTAVEKKVRDGRQRQRERITPVIRAGWIPRKTPACTTIDQ